MTIKWNILLLGACLVIAQPVAAGPGHAGHSHSHEVDAAGAQEAARNIVDKLIQKKKLDASWNKGEFSGANKKVFGDKTEWVVTFNNSSAKDPSKKTLYIFLTLEGKYLAANFTGQ